MGVQLPNKHRKGKQTKTRRNTYKKKSIRIIVGNWKRKAQTRQVDRLGNQC